MEAFKLMATDDDDDAPLQHIRESQTSHSSSSHFPTTPPRLPALEPDDDEEPVQEKTSRVLEKNDDDDEVLKTPNSAVSKIRPASTCPPAPRKPKAAPPLRKRKGSRKLLDLSTDVLSLYPPALLADFNSKLKKARRSDHHDQQKENICRNIS